jgi:hypothetical protein
MIPHHPPDDAQNAMPVHKNIVRGDDGEMMFSGVANHHPVMMFSRVADHHPVMMFSRVADQHNDVI